MTMATWSGDVYKRQSSGHVLLAFRDEVERTRMLAAHIKVEGELESDPGELFPILADVRKNGCACMASRQIRGITNVAYPVMGVGNHVIAAILSLIHI